MMKHRLSGVTYCVLIVIFSLSLAACDDTQPREEDGTNPTIAGEGDSVPEDGLYQGVWQDRQVTLKIVDKDGKPVAEAEAKHMAPYRKGARIETSYAIGKTDTDGSVVWENPFREKVEIEVLSKDATGTKFLKVKESDLDGVIELKLDMKAHG